MHNLLIHRNCRIFLALTFALHFASANAAPANEDPSTNAPAPGAAAVPEIKPGALPRRIKDVIKAEVGPSKITKAYKITEEGETTFEVEVSHTLNRSLRIASDGTLLGFEVFRFELPGAVKKVLRTNFASAQYDRIYREGEDDDTTFTLDVIEQGRTNSLSIAEAGDWWSLDITLEQAPLAARQTLRRLWGNLEATDVSKTFEDGEIAYEFEAEKDGKEHSLTIGEDGHLIAREDELEISLVPAAVQKTVKAQLGTGELLRIARATNAVSVSFEVEARKNNKDWEFSVDPTGKLIEDEN